jgi:beta-phosphoglucomutase-like phosphatase (HAD superfamily)
MRKGSRRCGFPFDGLPFACRSDLLALRQADKSERGPAVYDAIFFDLDGTLIDTERLAVEAGRHAFGALGHHDAGDLLNSLIGIDMPTAAGMIRSRYPGIDLELLDSHWSGYFDAAMAANIPLKLGADRLVHDLASRHAMALVTSSGRDSALRKLERSGLLPAFRDVITREDVIAPKPAPEPYLLAAQRLGVSPDRCLVFEDSEPGAEAAHRAGMRVVQVVDVIPATGRYAHHVAEDLHAGARWAGLID